MSDFRIDSSAQTHLDYGENPDKNSRHQGGQSREQEGGQKPYLDHNGTKPEAETRLKSRKTRKKRLEKKKRKLAERQARENSRDEQ